MLINLDHVWHCKACKSRLIRRGDILLCPRECIPVILPTDSEEAALRYVMRPQEVGDGMDEMARRAAQVELVAKAAVAPPAPGRR